MGYNPWATFDWNVSGTGALVTPFFSQAQQYIARVLSGLIIIGMYYGNYAWSAYTPINSAEAFANNGKVYNVTKVMGDQGKIDVEKYKQYGPPYFSGANVFGQGAWFAWYPMTLFYYSIRHWNSLRRGFQELWWSIKSRGSRSIYEGQEDDAQTRMMKSYPEVPEWWFMIILLVSFAFGVAAVAAFPTYTPWWSILIVIAMSAVFLIPSTIMRAVANVGMGFNVLFQLLAGVWWAGNPLAQIVVTAFGESKLAVAFNLVAFTLTPQPSTPRRTTWSPTSSSRTTPSCPLVPFSVPSSPPCSSTASSSSRSSTGWSRRSTMAPFAPGATRPTLSAPTPCSRTLRLWFTVLSESRTCSSSTLSFLGPSSVSLPATLPDPL